MGEAVGLGDFVNEPVEVDENDIVGVTDALAPNERGALGDADSDELNVELGDGVMAPLGVSDELLLGVGVVLIDNVPVVLGVIELEGVNEGLRPKDKETVDDADSDGQELDDEDGVPVGVRDEVPVEEPVAVKDGLCDAVTDEVRESEPVFDELAPRLMLAVSDIEIDAERDDELVGVTDDVAVPDTV